MVCTMTRSDILLAYNNTWTSTTVSVLPSILNRYWPNTPSVRTFSLVWERGGTMSFDVVAGSTQVTPFQYTLSFAWEGHCYCTAYFRRGMFMMIEHTLKSSSSGYCIHGKYELA